MTEQGNVQPIYIESDVRSPYGVLTLIETITGIFGQILALVLFLSASCRLYGREMSAAGAFWHVLGILDLSRDRIFRTFACAGMGVVFFVFVFFIVRNLIRTGRTSIKVFRSFRDKGERANGYFYEKKVIAYSMNTFMLFGIFNVLCTLVGGNPILNRTIPVFVVFGGFFLLRGWLIAFFQFDSPDLKETIMDSLRDLIFFLALSFLFFAIDEPAIRNIVNGITQLLNGSLISPKENGRVNFNSFYNMLISPVLYAVMAGLFLSMVFWYFKSFLHEFNMRKDLKKIVLITGILLLVQIALKLAMGFGDLKFSFVMRSLINSSYSKIGLLYLTLFLLELLFPPFRKGKSGTVPKTI